MYVCMYIYIYIDVCICLCILSLSIYIYIYIYIYICIGGARALPGDSSETCPRSREFTKGGFRKGGSNKQKLIMYW